jgi:uncharacterized DUF497 family protein
MIFEWDENKNKTNKAKHGIDFETARYVFEDPLAVGILERVIDAEERWQTIGCAGNELLLIVAHTYLESDEIIIRIISARKPISSERKRYENGNS